MTADEAKECEKRRDRLNVSGELAKNRYCTQNA